MQTTKPNIPGWGADLSPEQRPGVPMEKAANLPASPPPPQVIKPRPLKSVSVLREPAVFGEAIPLRGLSGVVRRIAYRIPEHHTRH